mmetsp:Transcript_77124/g.193974  ORF Transcript_77124/g.193974 Transcript_77124/m.193974 type:complete len:293 (+) Transcript_77124:85-963(+)
MFVAGGFKGKGKGKGKGSPEGGKGHVLPRTRISAEKFTGKVTAWKGKYGWIQPDEEIAHEKAKLHNGGLFCSMNYLIGRTDLEVGATVEFHICEDTSGLGAEEVVQVGNVPPGAAAAASKGIKAGGKGPVAPKGGGMAKGKDFGKGSPKGAWGKDAWGPVGGCKGWGAGPAPVMKTMMDGGKFGGGKCDGGKFGKGKGKGKFDPNRGKGHLLPRNRITAEKFTGTVTDWKGKYGWIQPAEEIQHEKAAKHQGRLFVSKDDIEGGEELTPGTAVEFHIWEDSTGLGAEEVVAS